jgi:hypothetical protein
MVDKVILVSGSPVRSHKRAVVFDATIAPEIIALIARGPRSQEAPANALASGAVAPCENGF